MTMIVIMIRILFSLYLKKNKGKLLYQTLKIQDLPLNNHEDSLNLLCFLNLYSFGINGQHETRQIKFHYEFIKYRLTFKYSQYRLN